MANPEREKKQRDKRQEVTNHTPVRAGLPWISNSLVCFALLCSRFSAVICRRLPFRLLFFFSRPFHRTKLHGSCKFKYCIAFYYVFVSLSQKWEIVSIFIVVFWSFACVCSLFSFGSSIIKLSFRLHSFLSPAFFLSRSFSPIPSLYYPIYSLSRNVHLYFDSYDELISKWNHISFAISQQN